MKYNLKKKYQIAVRRFYYSDTPSKEIIKFLCINKEGFRQYIDNQKVPGMLKENFGVIWGLDHIVPVEIFDLTNEEDLILCYHHLNIMPMINIDNRLKGSSVHFSLEKLHKKLSSEIDENNIKILRKLISKCEEEINNRYLKYLN